MKVPLPAFFLVALCCSATSEAQIIVPPHEMQGRCYGYLQVTSTVFSMKNIYDDCRSVRYTKIEKSKNPSWGDYSLVIHLKDKGKRCPYAVIELLHAEGDGRQFREVNGYLTTDEFKASRGVNPKPPTMACSMYLDSQKFDYAPKDIEIPAPSKCKASRHSGEKP